MLQNEIHSIQKDSRALLWRIIYHFLSFPFLMTCSATRDFFLSQLKSVCDVSEVNKNASRCLKHTGKFQKSTLLFITKHSMMCWNLTSKKSSTKRNMGIGSYCNVVSPTNLKKIRFRSPCEKNHKTLLSKVKSLNGRK